MVLLARRVADPGWWAEHGPHWASLPAPGTIFCKETFTADDLAELQDDDLVSKQLARGVEGGVEGRRGERERRWGAAGAHTPWPPP